MARPKSTPEHFWSRVDRSGGPDACWHWTGSIGQRTWYGQVTYHRKNMPAHRLAWILSFGPPPTDKPHVLHQCDVRYERTDKSYRSCCNPSHLKPGTARDNKQQMLERGRGPIRLNSERMTRGESQHLSKLKEADVAMILSSAQPASSLAPLLGVAISTVCRVRRRETWRHINSTLVQKEHSAPVFGIED